MTFLNPLILYGLAAISIPVIIHFFNLRKLKKVEFSTLMFLKELQKSKMKRIKLKQLLLLLLRVLIIVFLVLAFANPVYKGAAVSSSSSSATLIILDNSFSMSGKDAFGDYLQQGKTAVNDIISYSNPTDEIIIVPSSELGKQSPVFWTNSQTNFRDSINKIEISYKDFNFEQGISFAKSLMQKSSSLSKNIFIVSDFQKNNFSEKVTSSEQNDFSLFLFDIGKREINNISLEDFKIESQIIQKGSDVRLSVNVHNYSKYNLSNKTLNIYSKNDNDTGYSLVSEKVIDLKSSESKKVDLNFKANNSGNNSGMIELVLDNPQDDEIKYDNKIYFSAYTPEKFKIALAGTETKFISTAIETAGGLLADSSKSKSTIFEVNEISSFNSISNSDIVFIAGMQRLSDKDVQQISDYVSNGGLIYLFPSENSDINSYNSLLKKLNTAIISNVDNDADKNKNVKFSRVNFEHPLLSGIFKNENLNFTSEKFLLDSPELKSFYNLIAGEKDVTLIEMSNYKPFLIENKYGQGKILISSVSANNNMSDFPMKTIFVPLVIRSIFYSEGNVNKTSYIIGKTNIVDLNGKEKVKQLENPLNAKIDFTSQSSYVSLPYSSFSSLPGIYSAVDSSNNKIAFDLNFNQKESNILKYETTELENYLKDYKFKNIISIKDISQLKSSIQEAKFGVELWKYFLIAALIFVAAELYLSRKLMQE